MTSIANHADFALMEYVAGRELLAAAIAGSGSVMSFSVLAPVYPALGCGKLRILRVRPNAGVIEVIAGYESYERVEH